VPRTTTPTTSRTLWIQVLHRYFLQPRTLTSASHIHRTNAGFVTLRSDVPIMHAQQIRSQARWSLQLRFGPATDFPGRRTRRGSRKLQHIAQLSPIIQQYYSLKLLTWRAFFRWEGFCLGSLSLLPRYIFCLYTAHDREEGPGFYACGRSVPRPWVDACVF